MTIADSEATPDGILLIRCCWFDEKSADFKYHEFPEEMLTTTPSAAGGDARVITDEGWYGNDAHQRQAARAQHANGAVAAAARDR